MGSGFLRQKKQAKEMQSQMAKLQQTISDELEVTEVEGFSSQNLVKVTLSGTGELKNITIRPECIDPEDGEGLETLIKQAFQEAHKKVQEIAQSNAGLNNMQKLFGI